MYLYLVRHGQSMGNAGNKVPDPPLTDLGKQQALQAGEYIAPGIRMGDKWIAPPPEFLITSMMRRALQTAHGVNQSLGVPRIYVRPDVHEHTGPQPGSLTRETIHTEFPNVELDPSVPDGQWWPDDREPEADCYQRARGAAKWLRERFADFDGGVAMVTHGTFGHMLVCALLGYPEEPSVGFRFSNTGVTLLHVTEEYARSWFMNRTSHLTPDQMT